LEKLRVVTVVGTRPEIIRLSRLIPLLDEVTHHTLVHTGQNFDPNLTEVFFEDLGLRLPDIQLSIDGASLGRSLGSLLPQVEEVLANLMPQAVMVLGDTNSSLVSIICERMSIPVYHMEAGNRSFDANVPEELNRRLVDHISSFNLPYNESSRRNLLAEGLNPRRVLKTGSPLPEVIAHYADKISSSPILDEVGVRRDGYFLASFHRQENVDFPERLGMILESLESVAERWNKPVIISTHPRTAKRLLELGVAESSRLRFTSPMSFSQYCKLQANSSCVISDSGTISEESAILKFPAITIRDSMERPESLESGGIVLSGLAPNEVLNAVEWSMSHPNKAIPDGCEVLDFSHRVVSQVLSTAPLHKKWSGLNQ
jgi:UDP-N-acetylglucosamine 2-epimerase (non-hydrolysing)